MGFLAPHLLLWLVLPAALAVAYLVLQARRSRYAVRLATVDLLDSVAPDRPGWRRHLPAAGLLLALLALVVALARPVRAEQVPVDLATVVLALDVSISMDATDIEPDRITAARAAANSFLDSIPERVRVGLVAFAGTAVPLVTPTEDREVVRDAIERLTLQQGTAIGEAIFSSLELLERDAAQFTPSPDADDADTEPAPATIVVLSDGETTVGRPNELGAAAAREAGIAVSTIAFGTDRGFISFGGDILPVPVNDRALREIAQATGGQFFDAETAEALVASFAELGNEVGYREEEVEIGGRFLAAALALCSAAAFGSLRWFARLP